MGYQDLQKNPNFKDFTTWKERKTFCAVIEKVGRVLAADRIVFSNRVILTRKPIFSLAKRLVDDSRKEHLALAFEKLSLAMANVQNESFFGLIYQASLMFTTEDFYVPVLETLTNSKPVHGI